ncbi:MAG: hypothetical protein ACREBJ_08395 [Nitrosotalea sp.]
MFDLTVGESKKFEQLPEDSWVLARIIKRDVVRWVESEHKFNTSSDEVLVKLMRKLNLTEDEIEQRNIRKEISSYQFSFTFKPLQDKKFAGYIVRGRAGVWLNFTNTAGEYEPNKLARLYSGAGGEEAKKGEKINIDSILGNYVKVQVKSDRNEKTRKVYQHVVDVKTLKTEELALAKENEVEIDKIEKAMKASEEKSLEKTHLGEIVQEPVMGKEDNTKEVPF